MKHKAIFLGFIIILTSLAGCQSTKYVEQPSLKSAKSIGPTVTFTKAADFNFDSLECIAVGNISDRSASSDFPGIDRQSLVRATVYGHLAPKLYRDIEPVRVDFVFDKYSGLPKGQILDKLGCAALLTGQITKFENKYLITYSVTSVGLKLRLEYKTGQVIWSSEHVARNSSGAIPLSPIGIATGVFLAKHNAEDETAFQMIDAVVRRSLKALPNRSSVDLRDSIIEVPVTGTTQSDSPLTISDPIEDALMIGNYEKALTLSRDAISRHPDHPNSYYKGGRALLGLARPEEATDYFYEAVALNEEEDRYLEALGVAYIKLEKPDLALAAFEKAISLNEKNSFAYFNAAVVLENEQRYSKAADFYHAAGMAAVIAEDYDRARRTLSSLDRIASYTGERTKLLKIRSLIESEWPHTETSFNVKQVSDLTSSSDNEQ